MYMTLNKELTLENTFPLKGKSLSSILYLEKDAEKIQTFIIFQNSVIRENRTYAILISVYYTIHTRNLRKN